MNLKKITGIFLIITAVAFSFSCNKMGSGKAVVEIDNDTISMDEFKDYYYTQNKILLNMDKEQIDKLSKNPAMVNHPTVNKTKFMEFLISRKLILNKANSDTAINKDELKTIIELFKLQGVATYYLSEKLKDKIEVSDAEIENFYNKNRRLFRGVTYDENVENKIKQQIFLQKFEQKSGEFVMNLIAESKVNKEGFKKALLEEQKKEEEKKAAVAEKKTEKKAGKK